jgi:hypothetical protein
VKEGKLKKEREERRRHKNGKQTRIHGRKNM